MKIRHLILSTAIIFLAIITINGQNETTVKDHFEGTVVRLKIDMPATSQGIDVHPMKASQIDFDEYSRRLKQFGIAIYSGEEVMITKIKAKKKHIEFQLAGGGYGTWGDDTGFVSAPRVSKSSREKEIEELLKKDDNLKNKDELKKELEDLRNKRKLEQNKLNFEAEQTKAMKQAQIRDLALQSGSRFNIRYDHKIISGDLTVSSIKNSLSKYVDFDGGGRGAEVADKVYLESSSELSKGMLWEKVATIYGVPSNIIQREDCGLKVMECTYRKDGQETLITFVEGVVVSYQIKSY